MTPDSVLEALTEALAKKSTIHDQAVEAMTVVGPILDKVSEMKDLLERAIRLLGEWSQDLEDGPGPEFDEILSEVGSMNAKLYVQEPADWDYVRRFSATPNEIHDILRSGLHPNVYLAYQQAIGKEIVAEVAEEIRETGEKSFSGEDLLFDPVKRAMYEMVLRSADRVDPEKGAGPYPKNVVEP